MTLSSPQGWATQREGGEEARRTAEDAMPEKMTAEANLPGC